MFEYMILMTFVSQAGTIGRVKCEISADTAVQALRASRDAGQDLGLNVTAVVALSRRPRA